MHTTTVRTTTEQPAQRQPSEASAHPRPAEGSDRGATAVEYAMIASLIAAVVAATVALVGLDALSNWGITW